MRERPSGQTRDGRAAVLTCCLVLVLAGNVAAQPGGTGMGSKYYVWGQVHTPGAYSFLAAPDVFELISAAGGPTEDAALTRVIVIRAVAQTRTRVNLQAMLNTGQVVRLSPGDVVLVPSSAWYSFRTGLSVVSSVVTLITLVVTIATWVRGQP